uniref:Uncharacterized protein n=1 Tax=Ditylenchus dipsaci TaxID=166011 RepID=A0A915ECK4_9BILA
MWCSGNGHKELVSGCGSDQSLPSAVLFEGAPTIALAHPGTSLEEPAEEVFCKTIPQKQLQSNQDSGVASKNPSAADEKDASNSMLASLPTFYNPNNVVRKGSSSSFIGSSKSGARRHGHQNCHCSRQEFQDPEGSLTETSSSSSSAFNRPSSSSAITDHSLGKQPHKQPVHPSTGLSKSGAPCLPRIALQSEVHLLAITTTT